MRRKKTEAKLKALVELLSAGVPQREAAKQLKIGDSTLAVWKSDPDIRSQLEEATAKLIQALVARIIKASADDWRAAAWLLERRFPQYFARVEALAYSARMKAELEQVDGAMTPEERERRRKERLEAFKRIFNIADPEEARLESAADAGQSAVNGQAQVNGNSNGHSGPSKPA